MFKTLQELKMEGMFSIVEMAIVRLILDDGVTFGELKRTLADMSTYYRDEVEATKTIANTLNKIGNYLGNQHEYLDVYPTLDQNDREVTLWDGYFDEVLIRKYQIRGEQVTKAVWLFSGDTQPSGMGETMWTSVKDDDRIFWPSTVFVAS